MNTLLTRIETVENLPFAMHQLISNINSVLLKAIGVVFVSLLIFAAAFEIIHLHRIAGPMHRIEKVLEELSQGKRVGPIRLRKKDFFQNIAESLNKVMKFYNERDEKVQTILKEAKKLPELKEKIAELEPFFPDLSKEG
jgi:peptidoglycan hydrolase CwlO-like protein